MVHRRRRRYRRRYRRMPGGGGFAAVALGVVIGLAVLSGGHHHPGAPARAAARAPAGSTPGRAAAVAIAYARAQLGKPYLWGGTGPDAFDCSGLVMMAYRSAGISIPRTSQAQWAALPHVSSLQPGDLVFFAGADGTVADPGHVVMYIGDGKVIQAFATGTPVEISSLASMDAGSLTGYARPS